MNDQVSVLAAWNDVKETVGARVAKALTHASDGHTR
jgi:hypothetical protein